MRCCRVSHACRLPMVHVHVHSIAREAQLCAATGSGGLSVGWRLIERSTMRRLRRQYSDLAARRTAQHATPRQGHGRKSGVRRAETDMSETALGGDLS